VAVSHFLIITNYFYINALLLFLDFLKYLSSIVLEPGLHGSEVSLSDSVFIYSQNGGDFGIKQDNFWNLDFMAYRRATTTQYLLTLRIEVERFWIRPKVEEEGGNHNSITCYKQLSTVHLQQHSLL
jgi:hypothetical protein